MELFKEDKLNEMVKIFAKLMENIEMSPELRSLAMFNLIFIIKFFVESNATDALHWIFRRLSFMTKSGDQQVNTRSFCRMILMSTNLPIISEICGDILFFGIGNNTS